jgi:hypothetical protein
VSIKSLWCRLPAVGAVLAVIVAVPASASAAPTLTITPSNLQAGGSPTVTTDVTFSPAAGDTPKDVVIQLAPGLLANANANPTCLAAANTTPAGPCQIGTGSVSASISPTPITATAFLVPPASSADLAGIQIVAPPLQPVYAGISFRGTPSVGLNLKATLPQVAGVSVTELVLALNPTLNGNPFNRLPTSCSAATSTATISYYGATPTGTPSGSFTPTGCNTLAYSPTLAASATKDLADPGVKVVTAISQPATGQSASKTVSLTVPSGTLGANLAAATSLICADATLATCTQVGSASAVSPLLPLPLSGKVFLTGTLAAPAITVSFPAPFALRLDGAISILTNAVTFSSVPDVPLSQLVVTLNGGANALYTATCAQPTGTVAGQFTGQNGATATSSPSITVANCPTSTPKQAGPPTSSGASLTGVGKGKATLKFTVVSGINGAPLLKKVTVSLPGGLSFDGKKLKKALSVNHKFTYKLSGGKLTITLKSTASSVAVSIGSAGIKVGKALAKNVKKHKTKKLTVSTTATDASGKTTRLPLTLSVS